jgi:hypothetical protein
VLGTGTDVLGTGPPESTAVVGGVVDEVVEASTVLVVVSASTLEVEGVVGLGRATEIVVLVGLFGFVLTTEVVVLTTGVVVLTTGVVVVTTGVVVVTTVVVVVEVEGGCSVLIS